MQMGMGGGGEKSKAGYRRGRQRQLGSHRGRQRQMELEQNEAELPGQAAIALPGASECKHGVLTDDVLEHGLSHNLFCHIREFLFRVL